MAGEYRRLGVSSTWWFLWNTLVRYTLAVAVLGRSPVWELKKKKTKNVGYHEEFVFGEDLSGDGTECKKCSKKQNVSHTCGHTASDAC